MSAPSRHSTHRAFTLIEVTLATLMVGLLLVAAMKVVGQATSGQVLNGERNQAALLAGWLMAEIVELPYAEPVQSPVFGPEPGETTGGTRAAFDDVDDYHGWSASPPVDKQGTPLANGTGYTTSVTVDYVHPDNLNNAQVSDLGVKRVRVTVSRAGKILASLTTIVTRSS